MPMVPPNSGLPDQRKIHLPKVLARVAGVDSAVTAAPPDRHALMPWGPFNGRPVSELPDWYLFSLANKRLWAHLEAAVEAELTYRAATRRRAA